MIAFVVVLVAFAPLPAPASEKLPLPAMLAEAATATASIVVLPRAVRLTVAPVVTVESSMSAAVLPPIWFSASVTEMAKLNAAVPDAPTLADAETTSEVMNELSVASSVTAPDTSTRLLSEMTAWVTPMMMFVATAPVPLMAPATLPEPEMLTATATVLASTLVIERASMSSIPEATSTSEFSMPAVTLVPTVFSVSETATAAVADSVPLPETASEPATVVAVIELRLVASRVTSVPAETCCDWAVAASRITASMLPSTVFLTCATVMDPPMASLPAPATDNAAATPVTSMSAAECAVRSSAPPTETDESPISACVVLSIVLSASETAIETERLPLLAAATLADAATTSARIIASSVAEMVAPPAVVTVLPPMMPAWMVFVTLLSTSAPVPAPDRASLPLPLIWAEAATPSASIDEDDSAIAVRVPPASTVDPSTTARVTLSTSFEAIVPVTANPPEVLLPKARLTEAPTISAVMVVLSAANNETAPRPSVSTVLPPMMIASTVFDTSFSAKETLAEMSMAALPLPLKPAEAATDSASIFDVEDALSNTSPALAVTSTPSMAARVWLLMLLSATPTPTLPDPAVLPLTATLKDAATALAVIVELSIAVKLTVSPA